MVGFIHVEPEFAHADGFEAVSTGAFIAADAAADRYGIGDIENLYIIFFKDSRFKRCVVYNFYNSRICEDLLERGEIDRARIDDIGLVVATDLDETEGLIGECGFDIKGDVGLGEHVVDRHCEQLGGIDVVPRELCVHDAGVDRGCGGFGIDFGVNLRRRVRLEAGGGERGELERQGVEFVKFLAEYDGRGGSAEVILKCAKVVLEDFSFVLLGEEREKPCVGMASPVGMHEVLCEFW